MDRLNGSKPKIPTCTILEQKPPAIFASRLALKEGNNKKPIYQIHKWWARRLGPVFRALLLGAVTPAEEAGVLANMFYSKNNLSNLTVLDPFVGGGTTIVEAAKTGANVIGVDIDPVACFVTKKELEPHQEHELLGAFRTVERQVRDQILKWYRTTLSDGRNGTIIYAFWVEQLRCPVCRFEFAGHPHFQLSRDRLNKRQVCFCAHCGEVKSLPLAKRRFLCASCKRITEIEKGPVSAGLINCPKCGAESKTYRAYYRGDRPQHFLFALEVLVEGTNERVFKKADASDRRLYTRTCAAWAAHRRNERFVPRENIPTNGRDDPRPIYYGYRRYKDLFNDRQLLSLSLLAKAIAKVKDIKAREFLAIAFSDALASNNMFCLYAFDYQKLTPLFGLHAYRKVTRPVENNVWGTKIGRGSFVKCFQKLLRAKRYALRPFESRYTASRTDPEKVFAGEMITPTLLGTVPPANGNGASRYAVILNQSSERLRKIPSRSIDLILTDPPYYDNLPYSELSDFYHVWLRRLPLINYPGRQRRRTPMTRSLYVRRDHPTQASRDHQRFVDGLQRVFRECFRVLKQDGLLVFTFHHNDPRAWAALGRAFRKSGFRVSTVFPIRSEGRSEFHSAEGNIKWDAVFCCRKSRQTSTRHPRGLDSRAVWSKSRLFVRKWKRTLRAAKLDFGAADARSLQRAFATMYLERMKEIPSNLTAFFGRADIHGRAR